MQGIPAAAALFNLCWVLCQTIHNRLNGARKPSAAKLDESSGQPGTKISSPAPPTVRHRCLWDRCADSTVVEDPKGSTAGGSRPWRQRAVAGGELQAAVLHLLSACPGARFPVEAGICRVRWPAHSVLTKYPSGRAAPACNSSPHAMHDARSAAGHSLALPTLDESRVLGGAASTQGTPSHPWPFGVQHASRLGRQRQRDWPPWLPHTRVLLIRAPRLRKSRGRGMHA